MLGYAETLAEVLEYITVRKLIIVFNTSLTIKGGVTITNKSFGRFVSPGFN